MAPAPQRTCNIEMKFAHPSSTLPRARRAARDVRDQRHAPSARGQSAEHVVPPPERSGRLAAR